MGESNYKREIYWSSLIPCILFIFLNTIDTASTGIAVKMFGPEVELNPIMRVLIGLHPLVFVSVKLIYGLAIAIIVDLIARKSKNVNIIWFVCGFYLAISIVHIGSLAKLI